MKKVLLFIAVVGLLSVGYLIAKWPELNNPINQPAGDETKPGDNGSKPVSDEIIPVGNKLDLSNKQLKTVPGNVFNLANLEELNLSNNQLTGALPGEIRFLKNLKILNVSNNQLTGVPAEIGQLSQLEILDLSDNQLTGLPYELANLKKLKTFDLSGNQYSEYDLEIIKRGLSADVNIIK